MSAAQGNYCSLRKVRDQGIHVAVTIERRAFFWSQEPGHAIEASSWHYPSHMPLASVPVSEQVPVEGLLMQAAILLFTSCQHETRRPRPDSRNLSLRSQRKRDKE
ncbi:uncharacterized [Tachysurus ichikawai]